MHEPERFRSSMFRRTLYHIVLLAIVSSIAAVLLHEFAVHNFASRGGFSPWIGLLFQIGLQALILAPFILYFLRHLRKNERRNCLALRRLSESEERYRTLVEGLPDAILIHSEGKIAYLNATGTQLASKISAGELIGKSIDHLIPPGYREQAMIYMNANYNGEGVGVQSLQFTDLDGQALDIEYVGLPMLYEGKPAALVVARNVTQRNRIHRELSQVQEQLHNVVHSVEAGLWSFEVAEQRMSFASDTLRKMLDCGDKDLTLALLLERIHPIDQPKLDTLYHKLLQGTTASADLTTVLKDGHHAIYRSNIVPVLDEQGALIRIDGVTLDISDRVEAERKIEFLAFHDELTGLPNRRMLKEKLQEAIGRAEHHKEAFAVVYMDLDRFKMVNDTMGHSSGDQLLIQVTRRIQEQLEDRDILARIGGDEFTFVVQVTEDKARLSSLLSTIQDRISQPFVIDGQEVSIGASIGVSLYPHDATDLDTLMNFADTALFFAKESRHRIRYYNRDELEFNHLKVQLSQEIKKALVNEEITIVYQPKFQLSDHRLVGAEALLRWNHPQLGQVSPGLFIPVAEENGMIHRIGDWVLRNVCEQIRCWSQQGHALPISVNLSVRQFWDEKIVQSIRSILEESGIRRDLLELEITESMAMDIDNALPLLHELNKLGLRISVDDFGTGYSSLNYLRKLPIHQLKIDQSFVKDITTNEADEAIVSTVITLAHNLRLRVIAEGVETKEQVTRLNRLGCDEAQGYYFHRPLTLEQFNALLILENRNEHTG